MRTSLAARVRYALLGAAGAALVFVTTTALAGSGVGGVFNLGQTNTVDAKSTLTGATTDAQLLVQNTGAGTALNLMVGAGVTPFKVNSTTKVASLNADQLDGLDSSALQKRVTGTCASGQAIRVVNAAGTVTCQAVGGSAGSWSLSGNAGTTPGTNFLGTTDNQALELEVNGERVLRLEPDTGIGPNVIGGLAENSVTAGKGGAFIGGGGSPSAPNTITDNFGTVAGGWSNTADLNATVGGGVVNHATGTDAAIAGGIFNTAEGTDSTVGGGNDNRASGLGSTVPGGSLNVAAGDKSFAAGHQASALHDGAFVWADSTNTNFSSTANDQFLVRAAGGAPRSCAAVLSRQTTT